MGLFSWLTGRSERPGRANPKLLDWRSEWARTVEQPTADAAERLAEALDALGFNEEDIEVEREMLDGLRELLDLRRSVDSGLPILETGHRVIGTDRCHFSAPVSMPDEDAQPSGRLLLTSTRAVFVGGARTASIPWHAVGQARHEQRDIILIRKNRENLYRFRCNSFADALRGAFLSRQLVAHRQPAPTPSATRS